MDLAQTKYRLWRCRRVIATGTLLVAGGVCTAVALGSSLIALPHAAIGLPLLWAALLALLVVNFPHAWVEALAASLVTAGFVALVPGYEWLFSLVEGDRAINGAIWLGLLSLALWIGLTLAAAVGIEKLPGRVSSFSSSAQGVSALDPATLMAAVQVAPGKTLFNCRYGSEEPDGWFTETLTYRYLQPGTLETREHEVRHRIRVLESSETMQAVQEVEGETGLSAVVRVECIAHQAGTLFVAREVVEELPLARALAMWLLDMHRDWVTARLDLAEGRSPRAMLFLDPTRTPLVLIARRLKAMAEAAEDGPRL